MVTRRISTRLRALLLGLMMLLSAGIVRVYAQQPGDIALQFEFQAIKQGQIGLLTVTGGDLTRGTARVMDRDYPCYPTRTGLACLIAAAIDQAVTVYPLTLTFIKKDGSTVARAGGQVTVANGGFLTENFTLPGNLNYLLRDDIQANEDDRLRTIYQIMTPSRLWEGQFVAPVPNPSIVSAFGSIRLYTNTNVVRRHTGVDLRASTGTPVLASASGRVALSRPMDIHGNNVVIDHGWGIYSEYAHLSQRYVVPGQYVLQGDVIGLAGNTGRSTGPHVHWEIAVGGVWINPTLFAQVKLPQ